MIVKARAVQPQPRGTKSSKQPASPPHATNELGVTVRNVLLPLFRLVVGSYAVHSSTAVQPALLAAAGLRRSRTASWRTPLFPRRSTPARLLCRRACSPRAMEASRSIFSETCDRYRPAVTLATELAAQAAARLQIVLGDFSVTIGCPCTFSEYLIREVTRNKRSINFETPPIAPQRSMQTEARALSRRAVVPYYFKCPRL